MPLDNTLSEQYYRRSVKKYFVDNLYTADGVYVDFAKIYQIPKDNVGTQLTEWVRFHFNGLSFDSSLATGRVGVYMCTREDTDGVKLAALRDKVYNHMVDLSMPDGMQRVPLYDGTWAIIGGMMISYGMESTEELADDDTLYKYVNLYFKYAVK